MLKRFPVEAKGLHTTATLECPNDEPGDEVVVLASGLGAPELRGLRTELASQGRAALSVIQPRAGYMRGFGDVAELRARIIEQAIKQARARHGIGRSALIGHSLGGLDVVRVLDMAADPDQIASLDLVASAGITKEHLARTGLRLLHMGASELIRGNRRVVGRVVGTLLQNPLQFAAESGYGKREDLAARLSEIAGAVDTGVLEFEKDIVFPPRLTASAIETLVAGGAIRASTTTLPDHACHTTPLCDPALTARVLDKTLANRRSAR